MRECAKGVGEGVLRGNSGKQHVDGNYYIVWSGKSSDFFKYLPFNFKTLTFAATGGQLYDLEYPFKELSIEIWQCIFGKNIERK